MTIKHLALNTWLYSLFAGWIAHSKKAFRCTSVHMKQNKTIAIFGMKLSRNLASLLEQADGTSVYSNPNI